MFDCGLGAALLFQQVALHQKQLQLRLTVYAVEQQQQQL
jgi:hypothetical protein